MHTETVPETTDTGTLTIARAGDTLPATVWRFGGDAPAHGLTAPRVGRRWGVYWCLRAAIRERSLPCVQILPASCH